MDGMGRASNSAHPLHLQGDMWGEYQHAYLLIPTKRY